MTIAYAAYSKATVGQVSGYDITLTSPGTTGDLLVAVLCCDTSAGSWSPNDTGWTERVNAQHSSSQTYSWAVYTRTKGAGDPSTFGFTNTFNYKSKTAIIVAVSDGAYSAHAYAEDSVYNTAYDVPDVGAGSGGDMLLAFAMYNGAATLTKPSSMTAIDQAITDPNSDQTLAAAYEILASASAPGIKTFTGSSNAYTVGVSLRLSDTGGASGPAASVEINLETRQFVRT